MFRQAIHQGVLAGSLRVRRCLTRCSVRENVRSQKSHYKQRSAVQDFAGPAVDRLGAEGRPGFCKGAEKYLHTFLGEFLGLIVALLPVVGSWRRVVCSWLSDGVERCIGNVLLQSGWRAKSGEVRGRASVDLEKRLGADDFVRER